MRKPALPLGTDCDAYTASGWWWLSSWRLCGPNRLEPRNRACRRLPSATSWSWRRGRAFRGRPLSFRPALCVVFGGDHTPGGRPTVRPGSFHVAPTATEQLMHTNRRATFSRRSWLRCCRRLRGTGCQVEPPRVTNPVGSECGAVVALLALLLLFVVLDMINDARPIFCEN